MTTFLLLGMSHWSNKQEVPYNEIPVITGTTWGSHLLQAIQEQDEIGWDKLHRGFLSRKWRTCMDNYYQETDQMTETRNGTRWAHQVTTTIVKYSLKLWERRKNFLHGGHTKSSKLQRCEYLETKIKHLYQRYRGHLPRKYQSLFYLPQEMRIKHGIQQMELWVQRTTLLLAKYDRENGLQTNLESWILEVDQRAQDNNSMEDWDQALQIIQNNTNNSTQRLDTARQSIQSTITEWLKSWGNISNNIPPTI